jgi:hypothetical protein
MSRRKIPDEQVERIAEFVVRRREAGTKPKAAETAAMKEFGVTEPTVKRAWKRHRIAFRLVVRLEAADRRRNEAMRRHRIEEAKRLGLLPSSEGE